MPYSICIKKLYLFYLLPALLLITTGCSKSTTNITPKNTIPPGSVNAGVQIIPSSRNLILHVNDIELLTAKLYGGNGLLATTQPSFNWVSNATNVATVNEGTISAKQIGSTEIIIGDGVHSNGYIFVSVVADTTAIPTEPANITFNTIGLGADANSTVNIPSYTITDHKGQSIVGSPVFFLDTLSSSVIKNNTIATGGVAESINLYAKVNGKYLSGALPLDVHTNKTDTLTSIGISQVPEVFWYYNQISSALQINVRQSYWVNGLWYLNWFSANPQTVTVAYPQVIKANNDYSLTSLYPGITPVTLTYQKASLTFISGVDLDFSGSWGGISTDGTTSYNFCMTQVRQPILYNFEYPWDFRDGMIPDKSVNDDWIGGAYIGQAGQLPIADGCSLQGGITFGDNNSNYYGLPSIISYGAYFTNKGGTVNATGYPLKFISTTELMMYGVTMLHGAGNCTTGAVSGTPTLNQTLQSKTWSFNSCTTNLGYGDGNTIFTFNADGTAMAVATGQVETYTWNVNANNVITLNFTGATPPEADQSGAVTTLSVSSFNQSTISFSQIETVDQSGNDTETSAEAGCTLGFQ